MLDSFLFSAGREEPCSVGSSLSIFLIWLFFRLAELDNQGAKKLLLVRLLDCAALKSTRLVSLILTELPRSIFDLHRTTRL